MLVRRLQRYKRIAIARNLRWWNLSRPLLLSKGSSFTGKFWRTITSHLYRLGNPNHETYGVLVLFCQMYFICVQSTWLLDILVGLTTCREFHLQDHTAAELYLLHKSSARCDSTWDVETKPRDIPWNTALIQTSILKPWHVNPYKSRFSQMQTYTNPPAHS